ncbi:MULTISPECIES: MFS transporter [Streptomyces]|uniref:MFS transporter n=1 Tax=Streptomyces ardesiacus TaxID=285564 RepID=A0ABW8H2S9_9ACTN|nr:MULTISPECIES: MFS transporter [Streptomyces]KOU10727.1 major facilitator transporter [Streptomyces sp. NRRL F-4711]KOX30557.1 major facilitator transporter [Streptomyces sp. NRRL F-4707]NEB65307.1 MFS transporter [Streptomyces diastaticus]
MSGVSKSDAVESDVVGGGSLGRGFGWLWAAYAVSTFGTRLAFDAFPLIAVVVLDAGPGRVAALAAAGLAVGAVVAVPLGPWVEFRRKRPVMVATDLLRCAVLLSVPLAYAFGRLGFAQLLVVSVVVAAADITFRAAAGSCLKALVPPSGLLAANGRFEATTWTATMLGPPVGGAAIGLFGPVVTVAVDAVSYLLSALGIRAIGGGEPRPRRPRADRLRAGDLLDGWRYVLDSPVLRPLFLNTVLVNGLIMATAPLLAVLMLGELGFAPWQYGLAFAVPCVGGLVGSRLARPLVARFGEHRVLVVSGVLRVCWPVGLAFVGPGTAGLVLVMVVEFGLITSVGVYNPVFATRRLELTPADRVARTLSAWTISGKLTTAALTAVWGLLAGLTGTRTAVALAGAVMLATPLLLPRRDHVPGPAPLEPAGDG